MVKKKKKNPPNVSLWCLKIFEVKMFCSEMSRRKRSWADRRRFQKRSMQAGEALGANLRVRGQDRLLFRVQLWGRRTTHFAS